MTTTVFQGYTENDYGTDPYTGGTAQAYTGFQARAVINGTTPVAAQVRATIVDYIDAVAAQALARISQPGANGFQVRGFIQNKLKPFGFQARKVIGPKTLAKAQQALITSLVHQVWGVYLEEPYLEDPYLVATIHAVSPMQVRATITTKKAFAFQTRFVISKQKPMAFQTRGVIVDKLKAMAFQTRALHLTSIGMQVFVSLYNTTNLRLLASFPSRGVSGSNWTANSTEPGDFSIQNVNTDIEEQIWRSATGVKTSIQLICDTQVPQGVFNDTIAIRNHNLTTSATLTVEGSNDAGFATVGISIPVTVTTSNIYWISPTAPLHSYRYWRFTIDDPTNADPDNCVKIGVILFGTSQIFQGESFIDQVGFAYKDFADTVQTEGFTNVSNSRALRRSLHLEFRSLQFLVSNFQILRSLYTTYRTTHKILWIPTPDPVNAAATSRFAVFGKLTQLPQEQHNWKGANADYVSLAVDIDESL